jgi:hypothetical protein
MAIKGITISHSEGFQNVPNLEVWFENKPSGNPARVKVMIFMVLIFTKKHILSFKSELK